MSELNPREFVVPPEKEVASDTAESAENASIEEYLTRATALREKLQFWQRQEERGLSTLMRGVGKDSQNTMADEDVHAQVQTLQTSIDDAIAMLVGLEIGLFQSDILQQRYRETFGTEIRSVDAAKQTAEELLKPLYDRYIQHKKDNAGSGARTRDGISGVDAAWDVTAMAIPSGVDITDRAQLKNTQDQREAFRRLVKQLSLLPGPHHAFAKKFANGKGDADTAYQLLHSYIFGQNKSKRFQKLEMDSDWGQADLEKLEGVLGEADVLVKSVRDTFPSIDIISPKEARETYNEMRELFGKYGFLGIEANEEAFTLRDGQRLIDLTPEEKREIMRLLQEKLQEPDIAQFIERVKSGEINKKEWMLILQVPTISILPRADGIDADDVGNALELTARTGRGTVRASRRSIPITMQTMYQYFTEDMRAREQGRLLFDTTWYREEAFYTLQQLGNTDTTPETLQSSGGVGTLSWRLVTREVLPSSLGKNHTEQDSMLAQQAGTYGFEVADTRRRTPVEIVHHFFLRLRAAQERTMVNPWRHDCSQVRTARGNLVHVGSGDRFGLIVDAVDPSYRYEGLGVSLSC